MVQRLVQRLVQSWARVWYRAWCRVGVCMIQRQCRGVGGVKLGVELWQLVQSWCIVGLQSWCGAGEELGYQSVVQSVVQSWCGYDSALVQMWSWCIELVWSWYRVWCRVRCRVMVVGIELVQSWCIVGVKSWCRDGVELGQSVVQSVVQSRCVYDSALVQRY